MAAIKNTLKKPLSTADKVGLLVFLPESVLEVADARLKELKKNKTFAAYFSEGFLVTVKADG